MDKLFDEDDEAQCFWCMSGERGPAEKKKFHGKEMWFHGSILCGDQKHLEKQSDTNIEVMNCGTCKNWRPVSTLVGEMGDCIWEPSIPNPDSKSWTDLYGLPRAIGMAFYMTNRGDGLGCPCWKKKESDSGHG